MFYGFKNNAFSSPGRPKISDNAIRGRGEQVGGPVSRKSPPEADVGAPTRCVTALVRHSPRVRHSRSGAPTKLERLAILLVVGCWLVVGWLVVVVVVVVAKKSKSKCSI